MFRFSASVWNPTNGKKISFKEYKRADDIEFEKMQRKAMSSHERASNVEIKRVNKNLIEKEYEY